MSDAPPDWLPKALRYNDFNGDWDKFLAAVYGIFERDFKKSRPRYEGRPVTYNTKIEDSKEAAFWHVTTSTDATTQERVPELRRCERISWVRSVIEHPGDKALKVWRERRRRGTRIHLWLEDYDYVVVLAERQQVTVLVTAYCVDSKHTRESLRKRWKEFGEKQTPPHRTT
jgi:hypothetical protein